MNNVTRHAGEHSTDAGCRHLAARVINQAFRDLSGSGGTPADQKSARVFLAGSPMLYRWCEIANVSASWIIARARKRDAAVQSKTSDRVLITGDTRRFRSSQSGPTVNPSFAENARGSSRSRITNRPFIGVLWPILPEISHSHVQRRDAAQRQRRGRLTRPAEVSRRTRQPHHRRARRGCRASAAGTHSPELSAVRSSLTRRGATVRRPCPKPRCQ